MAITANHLTSSGDDTDALQYTTASISPSGNALVLLAVTSRGGTISGFSATGNGLTWVTVGFIGLNGSGANGGFGVLRAMGASPSSGAITITVSTSNPNAASCAWSVVEFTGVSTSGTNGSGAIDANGTGSGSGTSLSVAMGGAAADGNAWFGGFGNASTTAITPGGTWVELGEGAVGNLQVRVQTQWDTTGDETSHTATSGNNSWGGVYAEIVAPSGQPMARRRGGNPDVAGRRADLWVPRRRLLVPAWCAERKAA